MKKIVIKLILSSLFVILFSTCNLQDLSNKRVEFLEDFEDNEVDDQLSLLIMGEGFGEIEIENDNTYLSLELTNSYFPENMIMFGYKEFNGVLPYKYDISFDLFIEEFEENAIISALISTEKHKRDDSQYLFFSKNEGENIIHSGMKDVPFNSDFYDGRFWTDTGSFNLSEWIHVEINSITAKDEEPRYHEVSFLDYELSIRTFNASPMQSFAISIDSGLAKVRLDNISIQTSYF